MFKEIVMSCAAAVVLGGCFSATAFASEIDVNKVAPIHWGSHPYGNTDLSNFKTGKNSAVKNTEVKRPVFLQ